MGKRFGISSLGLLDVVTLHNVQIGKEKNQVDSSIRGEKNDGCLISCTFLMCLFLREVIQKQEVRDTHINDASTSVQPLADGP